MSPHAYTEDQLVEQPAVAGFAAMGWQTVSALGGDRTQETRHSSSRGLR